MALGRKILDSVRVVLKSDPAIEAGYDEYKKSGYDFSKLKFCDGQRPTVFHIKQWSRRQKNSVSQLAPSVDAIDLAIRCCLISVDNYLIENANGTETVLGAPTFDRYGDLGDIITVEWMDKANFLIDHKTDLYRAIETVGELSHPLGRRSVNPSGVSSGSDKATEQNQN